MSTSPGARYGWIVVLMLSAACEERFHGSAELDRAIDREIGRVEELVEAADSYDQERFLASLGTNRRVGSVFRFDEHVDEAVLLEKPAPDRQARAGSSQADGALAFEFDGEDSPAFERPGHTVEPDDGILRVDVDNEEYLIARDLNLAQRHIGEIELRVRARKGNRFVVSWSTRALDEYQWKGKLFGGVGVAIVEGGEFHTYRIAAPSALMRRMEFGDTIRTLAILPTDVDGDTVEIDYLRFIPKRRYYEDTPLGRRFEMIGGELRSVVHSPVPATFSYGVVIPERQPALHFGVGVLDPEPEVAFAVTLRDAEGAETELTSVTAGNEWRDRQVDLSRWAGERVEIRFSTAEALDAQEFAPMIWVDQRRPKRTVGERAIEGPAGRRAPNVAFWSNPVIRQAPAERFNILLVLEDALRAQNLSVYGHHRPTSPLKEELAKRGVVFDYAFSQSTWTRPSCPSLMTSLYISATGVWARHHVLDDAYLTLAEVLRSQGYETASFVQNSNAGPSAGLHQGFSYLFENSTVGRRPDERVREPLFAWLEEHAAHNFFVYLHLLDPHGPYVPDPPFDRWYKEGNHEGEPRPVDTRRYDPQYVSSATFEGRLAFYDGEIRQNDAFLAGVVDKLNELGIGDDTLIVFVSDHGEHFGEHERNGGPMTGHHWPAYAQGIRVPLLVSHPGLFPEGGRVDAPVGLIDVAPTILELAGVDPESLPLVGESLVAAWAGAGLPEDRVVVAEHIDRAADGTLRAGGLSVVFGTHHLVDYRSMRKAELFDYRQDPEEQRPIARGARSALLGPSVDRLSDSLLNLGDRFHNTLVGTGGDEVKYDPAAQEQLRQLGYID